MKKRVIVSVLITVLLCGCVPDGEEKSGYTYSEDKSADESAGTSDESGTLDESVQLAEGYLEIYNEAAAGDSLDSLETIGRIMEALGESGYPVVDTGNQIDMIHPEVIREFAAAVEKGDAAKTVLLLVTDDGGFVRYDLAAEKGTVQVDRSRLDWEEGQPCAEKVDTFEAHTWKLDEESGYLYIEKEQPAGYDGPIGYTAVRVEPLDEKLRELNRRYILPAGYRHTNLFLTDWDAENYGDLDFYDLFEVFYSSEYGKAIPYESDFEKRTYEVPAEEFENVITEFINIDTETLRSYTFYDSDSSAYIYYTRCREDWGYPCFVTPEVREYEEMDDGTIRLLVRSVSQQDDPEETFSHEVTVRPLSDGGYQYVSNHILSEEEERDLSWYAERMTVREWEEEYGGA